jgi:branched-chain amino acid transport system substrate-binding protein
VHNSNLWGRWIAIAMLTMVAATAAAQDIVVGQVGPFTVLPAPDAKQVNEGIRAYFAQVNAKGGINGRKIAFFDMDDQYSPDVFVKVFKEAMLRKPVALLTPIGSASIKRMLADNLLDTSDVLVLNAVPGAEAFRVPGHPKLFHIRAGDRQQIEKIVMHAQTLGVARMTVLYQNIPTGASGFAMAKEAADKAGKLVVTGFETSTEQEALAETAKTIAASDTQSVLVAGAPKYMADGIASLRKAGVSRAIYGLNDVPAGLVVKVAGAEAARGVGLAQSFPNAMSVSLPLTREFHAAMKEAYPALEAYSSFHLEGYLSARVLSEAIRRTRDVTPDGIARSLRAMGEVDLGGFRVNFSKSNIGSHFVDIGVVTGQGRLMY